jgi:hypothetical protein
MEGWRQRRLGSKEDHSTTRGNYKTDLTLTGPLMEGPIRRPHVDELGKLRLRHDGWKTNRGTASIMVTAQSGNISHTTTIRVMVQ